MAKSLDTNGKNFIKDHEGYNLTVYKDVGDKLTVGYGHLVVAADNLKLGDKITQTKADDFFVADIKKSVDDTNTHPKVDSLSQSQFNAVIAFVFNVGTAPVTNTGNDLYKALNDSNTYKTPISDSCKKAIVTGFTYTKVGDKRVEGLVNRRNDELNLFLGTKNVKYITM